MERIDDLQCHGYRIIQNPDWFCFGMDAVLLSEYARSFVNASTPVMDLCTGSGVIPLLLAGKTDAVELHGMEIQPEISDMARRSVALNDLTDRITIETGYVRAYRETGYNAHLKVVTVNPPYMKSGLYNASDRKSIARHEVLCTLEDVMAAASYLLKSNGRLFMVHRPERLADIVTLGRKYHLEPKRMRFVHPYIGSSANMVLLEAVKGGGVQLTVEKPLIVYREKQMFSDEIREIYGFSR